MRPPPGTQTRTGGTALGGRPAARGPRHAPLRGRARGWRAAWVLRSARLPRPPPQPCPQGEEPRMGTCDFLHQWTQTHPSRARGGGWGRGAGGGGKNFSRHPGGWPKCSPQARVTPHTHTHTAPRETLRSGPPPPPACWPGSLPPRPAHPADPATRARTRPGRRERGLAGLREAARRAAGVSRAPAGLRRRGGGSGQAPRRAAGGRGGRRGPCPLWRGAGLTLCGPSGDRGSGVRSVGWERPPGQPARGRPGLPPARPPAVYLLVRGWCAGGGGVTMRAGTRGVGCDVTRRVPGSSGRARGTPRSLPPTGGGGRRRLAAAGVLAPAPHPGARAGGRRRH